MAKNFLDKALDLIGLKSPNATDYYDPSVYKPEVNYGEISSKPSKVEKNQQKQNASSNELSGVTKYLAEKQRPKKEKTTIETANLKKLTGVAKYLATKQHEEQATLANMTGVARYLFNLTTHTKNTPSEKISLEAPEASKKLSRVDIYLAKKQEGSQGKQAAKISRNIPKEVLRILPKESTKEETSKIQQKAEIHANKKTKQTLEKATNKIIDFSEGATQCQAETLKRIQCSRKTSLETIKRTINQQRYKFAVCSQHNKESFIPFADFLQEKP